MGRKKRIHPHHLHYSLKFLCVSSANRLDSDKKKCYINKSFQQIGKRGGGEKKKAAYCKSRLWWGKKIYSSESRSLGRLTRISIIPSMSILTGLMS